MKCTNRFCLRAVTLLLSCCMAVSLTACGERKFDMPYDMDGNSSSFKVSPGGEEQFAECFAENICVVSSDILDSEIDMSGAGAAVLFDINGNEVMYSKNAHERLHPASLTKILTAIVALKHGSTDQVLTATRAINIDESGAQLCGLKVGDTMTLNQALNILLVYSANDVAMLIAEGVGGTVDKFIELMNEEARALGATNSHFMNPHGLTQEEHYTTAYDLYLIFNEAVKNEKILEIIRKSNYETVYYDKNGKEKSFSHLSTNWYLRGEYKPPEAVSVVGGKTGTTNAAGHCLMILSRDTAGNPYISIVLRSEAREMVYTEMTDLLEKIIK